MVEKGPSVRAKTPGDTDLFSSRERPKNAITDKEKNLNDTSQEN